MIKEFEATYDARTGIPAPPLQEEAVGPLSAEVEDFLRKIGEDFTGDNR